MNNIAEHVKQWRMKAEELRSTAENIQNPFAQASFRRMAEILRSLGRRLWKAIHERRRLVRNGRLTTGLADRTTVGPFCRRALPLPQWLKSASGSE